MANASTWPSTNRASERFRAAQSASDANRAAVPPEPGFGSVAASWAAIPLSSSHALNTLPLESVARAKSAGHSREHEWSRPGTRSLARSARRIHVRSSLYDHGHSVVPVDGQDLRCQASSGPKPDGYLRTATTDSGVALSRYELGLRQIKDQFVRARRQHLGDDSLELHHRSDVELT